jgi:two-component sensor histidine kinase
MAKKRSPSGPGRNPEQRFLKGVLALNRIAAAEPPWQEFLDQVVAQVAKTTEIRRIKVLRYRPQMGDLLVEAGTGWSEGVVGNATLPIDISSPPGRTIQTAHSTIVEDFNKETELKLSPMLHNHGIVSLINVPIKLDGAIWGVLEADSEQPRGFSEDLSSFLKAVAHMIGLAARREEHKQKVEDLQTEITREVARREILLSEMHHRVKNNFQVIISTLLIQRRRVDADECKQLLQAMSNRVMAISLAHDQLDPRQSAHTVSISTYLGALCRTIGQVTEDVGVDMDFDEGMVPVEDAVALGLILNELLTNSLKHAFDGPGRITVAFHIGPREGEACMTVADDGKGMKKLKRDGSSGTTLIEALTRQLQGRIERESPRRGTVVRICFPLRGSVRPS